MPQKSLEKYLLLRFLLYNHNYQKNKKKSFVNITGKNRITFNEI